LLETGGRGQTASEGNEGKMFLKVGMTISGASKAGQNLLPGKGHAWDCEKGMTRRRIKTSTVSAKIFIKPGVSPRRREGRKDRPEERKRVTTKGGRSPSPSKLFHLLLRQKDHQASPRRAKDGIRISRSNDARKENSSSRKLPKKDPKALLVPKAAGPGWPSKRRKNI